MTGHRLCFVVVLLGVASAAAQEHVARYPRAMDTSLAPGLGAMGEHFEASYFTTPDPPEVVARFYAKAWESGGLPVRLERVAPGSEDLVVSAFLTRNAEQWMVILHPRPHGSLGFRVERSLSFPATQEQANGAGARAYVPVAIEAISPGVVDSQLVVGDASEVWRRRVADWEERGFRLRTGSAGGMWAVLERSTPDPASGRVGGELRSSSNGPRRTDLGPVPQRVTLLLAPMPDGRIAVIEQATPQVDLGEEEVAR